MDSGRNTGCYRQDTTVHTGVVGFPWGNGRGESQCDPCGCRSRTLSNARKVTHGGKNVKRNESCKNPSGASPRCGRNPKRGKMNDIKLSDVHAPSCAAKAAMLKSRKTCYTCRWCALERNGKNKAKRASHWYCNLARTSFASQSHLLVIPCCDYKRKSKSKETKWELSSKSTVNGIGWSSLYRQGLRTHVENALWNQFAWKGHTATTSLYTVSVELHAVVLEK